MKIFRKKKRSQVVNTHDLIISNFTQKHKCLSTFSGNLKFRYKVNIILTLFHWLNIDVRFLLNELDYVNIELAIIKNLKII